MSKMTGKEFLIGVAFVVVFVLGGVGHVEDAEYKARGNFKSEYLTKIIYYQEYQLDSGDSLIISGNRGTTPKSQYTYQQCIDNRAEFNILYKKLHERFFFFKTGRVENFAVHLSCSFGGNEVEVFDIRNNA